MGFFHYLCQNFKEMKRFYILILSAVGFLGANAQSTEVRWHNENSDTVKITELLKAADHERFASPSARTAWFGRQLIGTPYVAHTLEGDKEVLTVNMDELDCTTFVETALALAYTCGERRTGWQDFVYNLRRIRYRSGEVSGYGSRLHYICDWAMDNIHRGNLVDVTPLLSKVKYMVRSIDFMSGHRDKYPALADSAEFARIKGIENGFRNHRFPYIKTSDLASKEVLGTLREGDILAFVSNLKDLDVTHMGMVVEEDGKLYALHASSSNGKVEISKSTLPDFVKRNRGWIGVRIFRLKE